MGNFGSEKDCLYNCKLTEQWPVLLAIHYFSKIRTAGFGRAVKQLLQIFDTVFLSMVKMLKIQSTVE